VTGGGSGELEPYLDRPITPPGAEVTRALEAAPIDHADVLPRDRIDRLLDPAPLAAETGWCTLANGVGYVSVRTAMPEVTGEMVDWWFDWHPRDPLRYRVWHPAAHVRNGYEPPPSPREKAHWGAVHHPVEDVGTGVAHLRIEFVSPSELGFATDVLEDPDVATVVCGFAGDDRTRMRNTVMAHVFLAEGDGVVLRSRFWIGAAIRPYLPAPLGDVAGLLLDNRVTRRIGMPARLPEALASHCAEEYANLGSLLPELYSRFA
jgi:hypothetical protein